MDGPPRRIRPWMVAVALALVGVAGATAVTIAARNQHARDRADVQAWIAEVMPAVERARTARTSVAAIATSRDPADVHPAMVSARSTLEAARSAILAGTVPKILRDSAAEFAAAVSFTLRAVALLDEAAIGNGLPISGPHLTTFRQAMSDADAAFTLGDRALAHLRCRADLPECTSR